MNGKILFLVCGKGKRKGQREKKKHNIRGMPKIFSIMTFFHPLMKALVPQQCTKIKGFCFLLTRSFVRGFRKGKSA